MQIRKVLPLALFSSVVSPWMTPSLTDQSRGSPSQPVRSLPLKRHFMSSDSGGAHWESAAIVGMAKERRARRVRVRIMVFSVGKGDLGEESIIGWGGAGSKGREQ